MSDDAIKSFFNLKKEVKAACPVNVYIYDEEDHLVAYVEDGVVSCSVDDLVIAQDGDEKIIRFYDNANYRVEYSGYDEGTMDIVITEFDDTQIARTVNYNNLPVTSSQIYSSTIDNQMFKPYRLTDNTDNSDVTYDYDSMQSTSKHKLKLLLIRRSACSNETVYAPFKPYSNDDPWLEIPNCQAEGVCPRCRIAARICAASVRAAPSLRRHKFNMITLLRFSKNF